MASLIFIIDIALMLPRDNKLKKKKDFENVFKRGKGFKEDFLYLKIVKNKLKTSRFAVVVGKNFSKKAVERNKIKRQIREIIQANLPEIKPAIDGVIVVLPKTKTNFPELKKTIDKLFKKAKLF